MRHQLASRDRVAVLLNANAKQVNPRVARSLGHLVDDGDFYYSHSLDEAREFTREIVARGYRTVCAGGGDGTVTNALNNLLASVDAQNALHSYEEQAPCPSVGVLRLGNGNALASLLGATSAEGDLRRFREGDTAGTTPLQFVESEGRLAPFAGLGLDAAIVNDFEAIKDTFWGRHFKYAASIIGRSIPLEARGRCRAEVEIVNRGAPAIRLDMNGRAVGEPIPAGELLYRGPVWVVGAGTVPFVGYQFKAFPFALDRPGRMQLRVLWCGLAEMLWHLRDLWQGRYQTNLLDFACDDVSMTFSRPFPYQVAGDASGERSAIRFRMSPRIVDFLTLRPTFLA